MRTIERWPTRKPESVGTRLLDEIERVSAMRERWRRQAADLKAEVSFAPAIYLMTTAIDAGKAAIAKDDGIASISALKDLEGFDHEY